MSASPAAAVATTSRGSRDFFATPAAALVRPLGTVAADEGAPTPVPYRGLPGLGVPLGGVGAGSFMVNQCGTFGPWSFGGQQGTSWETRTLPQAAFHVREQVAGQAPTVRTLAVDSPVDPADGQPVWQSPLPAWNRLQPGEGEYAALYPFGFITYEPFATDVSLRFYSPIEAGEDRRTSLPVAYFDVRLANHTAQRRRLSVMFTMPNAPAHVPGTRADETVPAGVPSVRQGFRGRYDAAGSVRAVTLSARDAANTEDSDRSEWTIAAKVGRGQRFSWTTSWNADGDGLDVYRPFQDTGDLPGTALDDSYSAAAVCVSLDLAPGEVVVVPFVLAWDFPKVVFADGGTVWMRRYTNFYGAKTTKTNEYVDGSYPFGRGFAIAQDALRDAEAAVAAVRRWWQPIADCSSYPALLRCAALNQLAELVWNNSFWEGGLVRHSAVATGFTGLGAGQHLNADVRDSHLFGIQDTIAGGVSGMGGTTSIQVWNHRPYFTLFPNLLRDSMLASMETVRRSPNGNAHDLYTATGNPFITFGNAQDAFIQGGTDSRPPAPGRSQWLDSPGKFVLQWYAYAQTTGDDGFLRRAWPVMKTQLAWLKGTIPAGSLLPSDAPLFNNPYNAIPQGPGPALINSGFYLLILTTMIAAGTRLKADRAYVAGLQKDLDAARKEFEATFWDEKARHYRFSTGGLYPDAVTVGAFLSQHLARTYGLPDLVDPEHQRTELLEHHVDLLASNAEGEVIGAPLLSRAGGFTGPDGTSPVEVDWVMVGDNFTAAADRIDAGHRFRLPELVQSGLELAEAVATQIWSRPGTGLAFAAPWSWLPDDARHYVYPGYSQALAVWDVLHAIKPITPSR
ncbi:GH116 family glycosyl-hydrolase [Kineococcus sp. SYSU DK003]|uniref:GH116 family glycosyl-hydrolase n=1 Tax=Kineococcus sp. SYSU DK003 TaxID=3383124 RepID=UPI003D7D4BD0